ncbi:MAG TPA: hypothetical protein VMG60_03940 [Burkholderiaceae bacterium]|nr:hypothetical protein [Burkholderiaceae bacterium]
MNKTSTQTRIAGFVFSVLMSSAVLGSTVLAMQSGSATANTDLIALERVVITATAVN